MRRVVSEPQVHVVEKEDEAELEDGAEVTVLDGVESRMEAEDLVEVVQRRLARNPRRP